MIRFFALILALLPFLSVASVSAQPDDYVWTAQSRNSSESMPCGGGDVGMNVWVEDGDVLIYIARSGWFDDNNSMLKAGRFRIQLGSGIKAENFRQTLHLNDGYVDVTDGEKTVKIWADVYSPTVHFEIKAQKPIHAACTYESWRYKDRSIRKLESQQCSYKFGPFDGLVTRADSIFSYKHSLIFRHVNRDSTVFDTTMVQQQLGDIKKKFFNPISGKSFGGTMQVSGMTFVGITEGVYADTDYRGWKYASTDKKRNYDIAISLSERCKQRPWKDSKEWWNDFWKRSFIQVEGEAKEMARNYELFRYMLGCNAHGAWPTKFNGGLFTFDPGYVDRKYPFTPDFRRWGGGTFTAQNQRLVYWPMLKSGDVDMMSAQFEFYNRLLDIAKARTEKYWNHGGANFNEQIENFGLPNHDEYGRKRPAHFDAGMEYNAWLEYTWDTILEFCQMILDSHSYYGTDISSYIPLITSSIDFFDEHYRMLARERGRKELDGDNHLVLFPSSGCETFKMAYNPSSTIAGLKKVTTTLINYFQSESTDTTLIKKYERIQRTIPPVPTRIVDGHEVLSPAVTWQRVNNIEPSMLYPVFPWREYGVGRDSLEIALNTWRYDPYVKKFSGITSWEQYNIWAACLGQISDAVDYNKKKMASGPHRFPAFWGPGHDWTPDHNWGGSGMIGMQEMLMQEVGDKILLFPAWPKNWDVHFRLHASKQTTVEVALRNGKVTLLDVTPNVRRSDVKIMIDKN